MISRFFNRCFGIQFWHIIFPRGFLTFFNNPQRCSSSSSEWCPVRNRWFNFKKLKGPFSAVNGIFAALLKLYFRNTLGFCQGLRGGLGSDVRSFSVIVVVLNSWSCNLSRLRASPHRVPKLGQSALCSCLPGNAPRVMEVLWGQVWGSRRFYRHRHQLSMQEQERCVRWRECKIFRGICAMPWL